jgi:hypothetical protein
LFFLSVTLSRSYSLYCQPSDYNFPFHSPSCCHQRIMRFLPSNSIVSTEEVMGGEAKKWTWKPFPRMESNIFFPIALMLIVNYCVGFNSSNYNDGHSNHISIGLALFFRRRSVDGQTRVVLKYNCLYCHHRNGHKKKLTQYTHKIHK